MGGRDEWLRLAVDRARIPMAISAKQRYLEARRKLDDVASRLSRLDQQADAGDTPTDRRAILTEASDPAAAAQQLLEREWPDRVDLHQVVTEWLTAYQETTHLWARLPPATQLRLAQPRGDWTQRAPVR